MRRSDVVAGIVLGVFALLIAAAIMLSGRIDGDDAPADDNRAVQSCDRGVDLQQCEEALVEVELTLKNAATAQESYAVSTRGRYTKRLSDLEGEGLRLPSHVELTIVRVGRHGYCLQATSRGLVGAMHYSSREGTPLPGLC